MHYEVVFYNPRDSSAASARESHLPRFGDHTEFAAVIAIFLLSRKFKKKSFVLRFRSYDLE